MLRSMFLICGNKSLMSLIYRSGRCRWSRIFFLLFFCIRSCGGTMETMETNRYVGISIGFQLCDLKGINQRWIFSHFDCSNHDSRSYWLYWHSYYRITLFFCFVIASFLNRMLWYGYRIIKNVRREYQYQLFSHTWQRGRVIRLKIWRREGICLASTMVFGLFVCWMIRLRWWDDEIFLEWDGWILHGLDGLDVWMRFDVDLFLQMNGMDWDGIGWVGWIDRIDG